MPKKALPLTERKGLKNMDPDYALNLILDLSSFEPCQETLEIFFPGREKFYLLHRWIEGQVFDYSFDQRCQDTQLVEGLQELSKALYQLANNKDPNFFKISRQTGNRSENLDERTAVFCALAAYHDAQIRDQNTPIFQNASRAQVIDKWWANLRKNSHKSLPKSLQKKLANVEQEDGETKNKILLLAFHASFIDLTDDEAEERSKRLRQYAELVLLA